MGRIGRGFRLVRASWEVLRHDRSLIWLPLASMAGIIVFAALVLLPAYSSGLKTSNRASLYALLIVVYFVSSLIATFCNAAIVAAASDRLNGGAGSVRVGLRLAWSRIDRIIAWAAISATVGLLVRLAEQRSGFLGSFVARFVGAAWAVITFLVIPVLIFEPVGPINAVKRSGSLFRQRWGEQLVGNGSITLALFLVAIPLAIVCAVLEAVAVSLAVAFGVVAFAVLLATGSAMTGIFNAALYRYAVTGEVAGPFGAGDLQGSFRPRGGSWARRF